MEQLLAPYLENALAHTNSYNAEDIENYLAFFANVLGPHLGRGPLVSDFGVYRPQYPSAMTKDLTPFELSLCWKERKQQVKPIVRLVNDFISPNAEMTRTASLAQLLRFIYALEKVTEGESSDLTLHCYQISGRQFRKSYRLQNLTYTPKLVAPDAVHHPRSLAFDLKQSVASGKFYWRLPSCLDITEALELMEEVFIAYGWGQLPE